MGVTAVERKDARLPPVPVACSEERQKARVNAPPTESDCSPLRCAQSLKKKKKKKQRGGRGRQPSLPYSEGNKKNIHTF